MKLKSINVNMSIQLGKLITSFVFLNPLEAGDIVGKFHIVSVRDTYTARFSSDSEVFASKLLENREYMFHRYYIHNDKFSTLTSLTTL